ncbi:hypothetical protein HZC35_05485 [Candidatus Saganbacteria bacterium]|nr:hypothetical protein [Candidatus Saganbacteria bacterium]
MKKFLAVTFGLLFLASQARGILTFYLVDNFEDGTATKWYAFDRVNLAVDKVPKTVKRDLVVESDGDYLLKVSGAASDWYAGGIGTALNVDARDYSRLQFDVWGSSGGGKIKLEVFENDTKWTAELPILGKGATRYSIPFTALTLDSTATAEAKERVFSTGLTNISRLQLIFVAPAQAGAVDCSLDNIIFTY